MIDNITDYIEFSTNTIVPDVYTNIHHKLLCVENSEQMLLNSTQIDWQEAHLKHINQIPGIQPEFRLNTTEELLWIIDTLVLKAFGVKPILSITTSGIQAYNGQQQRPTITVKEGDNVIDSSYYEVVFNEENSINADTYTFNVNLTPEGEAKYAQPAQQTYTIPQRNITITPNLPKNQGQSKPSIQNDYIFPSSNDIIQENLISISTNQLVQNHNITQIAFTQTCINAVHNATTNKSVDLQFDKNLIKIYDNNNNDVTTNYQITCGKQNVNVTIPTVEQTYYWYVGQTDPSTMTEISPIVTDKRSPGWRLIGTTLPTYNSSNKLWDGTQISTGTTKQTNYVALPNNTLFMYDAAGNISSGSWLLVGETEIGGLTYYVYSSVANLKTFGFNIY